MHCWGVGLCDLRCCWSYPGVSAQALEPDHEVLEVRAVLLILLELRDVLDVRGREGHAQLLQQRHDLLLLEEPVPVPVVLVPLHHDLVELVLRDLRVCGGGRKG